MFRFVSLLLRKWQKEKRTKKTLHTFYAYKRQLEILPPPQQTEKKILIIRIDDIGDYLLFRNTLPFYKNNEKWNHYRITLLGNIVWKDLFDSFDKHTMDETIWIDKKEYFAKEKYRLNIWNKLSNEGFETVICASRTRPVLLDDICMLSCGAKKNIGCKNTLDENALNFLSDQFYSSLFEPKNYFEHEFYFNADFANWCCDTNIKLKRPQLLFSLSKKGSEKYIICFIGASAQSKRWPAKQWVELIKMIKEKDQHAIFVIGGENEVAKAEEISQQTGATNMAGKLSLTEMARLTSNAVAVITNDSMALHLAASCNVPAIVIANGSKAYRFNQYEEAGIQNVKAVYPRIFLNKYSKKGNEVLKSYTGVTADIATIKATDVYEVLEKMI